MFTEILNALFLLGVPIWFVVEAVLHETGESHVRSEVDVRRSVRRTVASDHLPRAA